MGRARTGDTGRGLKVGDGLLEALAFTKVMPCACTGWAVRRYGAGIAPPGRKIIAPSRVRPYMATTRLIKVARECQKSPKLLGLALKKK